MIRTILKSSIWKTHPRKLSTSVHRVIDLNFSIYQYKNVYIRNSNMNTCYISDIHLEFCTEFPKIRNNAEILILGGDIGNPYQDIYKEFLEDVSNNFEKVFMVTGNHEYYAHDNTIIDTNEHIKKLMSINNMNNVIFLDNDYHIHEQFRFVGTTLWSHITKHKTKYLTNCFFQIKDFTARSILNGTKN